MKRITLDMTLQSSHVARFLSCSFYRWHIQKPNFKQVLKAVSLNYYSVETGFAVLLLNFS